MDYGYARVSSADQDTAVQVQMLQFAGCGTVYEEKASGADDARPVLAHVMRSVTNGDTLTVCKIDRIARSTSHLLRVIDELAAKGASFRVLNLSLDTATPTGKLMLTMLGAVATFEREIMLERQAEGIARAKAAGKYLGRATTARDQSDAVMALLDEGYTNQAVADRLCIGVASVYRIKKLAGGAA